MDAFGRADYNRAMRPFKYDSRRETWRLLGLVSLPLAFIYAVARAQFGAASVEMARLNLLCSGVLLVVMLLGSVLLRPPHVVVDQTGIGRPRGDRIPWSAVQGLRMRKAGREYAFELWLSEPDQYAPYLDAWPGVRADGSAETPLRFPLTRTNADYLRRHLRRHVPQLVRDKLMS